MTEFELKHGLSQDEPGPLEPVELALQPGAAPATGNTARDQEMYAAGIRTGEENTKHNAAIRGCAAWLPIESAPKDSFISYGLHHYGTKIIVFDGSINTARWWRIEGDSASNFIDEGGRAIYPTHWMPLPAAPGVSTVEDPSFPNGAIVNGRVLADRLEAYPFESQGGDLRLCSDWVEFRRCFEYLAEWVGSRAPAAGDAQGLTLAQKYEDACILANANARDAARYRQLRKALTSYDTGWLDRIATVLEAMGLDPDEDKLPTPEQVDSAFDAAQRKGDA